jgi:DNA polymerase I-like protein with 3'-5' exonuclease and polymerase domains
VVFIVEYPRFSDFADDVKSFEGDKKKIEDILNEDILILDFKVKDSKQRKDTEYATIQFRLDDTTYIIFTGSNVLIDQLNKYAGNIPFYTTIKKIDKYYTFA